MTLCASVNSVFYLRLSIKISTSPITWRMPSRALRSYWRPTSPFTKGKLYHLYHHDDRKALGAFRLLIDWRLLIGWWLFRLFLQHFLQVCDMCASKPPTRRRHALHEPRQMSRHFPAGWRDIEASDFFELRLSKRLCVDVDKF